MKVKFLRKLREKAYFFTSSHSHGLESVARLNKRCKRRLGILTFSPSITLHFITRRNNMATPASARCFRTVTCYPGVQLPVPKFLAPTMTYRHASGLSKLDTRGTRPRDPARKKKKARTEFINHTLKDAMQFSLCEAMRYLIHWHSRLNQ